MKKKLFIILIIMILMCTAGIGAVCLYESLTGKNEAGLSGNGTASGNITASGSITGEGVSSGDSASAAFGKSDEVFTAVSSFYPIYVILENLVDGTEGVEVHNLTENATGCLHDYTLSTKDMKRLAKADIFIINGIDTEPFLDDIGEVYPKLPIFSSTDGIDLICSSGHVHDHNHEDADHDHEDHGHESHDHEGEYNGHVWTDMNRYLIQIENVCEILCGSNPGNASVYRKNAEKYSSEIKKFRDSAEAKLAGLRGERVIIFHDSFAYLADEFGLEVAYTLELEDDEALSGGEIAKIIEIVKEKNVKYMFVEKQYSDVLAKGISRETDAEIICLDSMVTGDGSADSYLKSMEENVKVLERIKP